jgi:hypothetical protein
MHSVSRVTIIKPRFYTRNSDEKLSRLCPGIGRMAAHVLSRYGYNTTSKAGTEFIRVSSSMLAYHLLSHRAGRIKTISLIGAADFINSSPHANR